MSCKGLMRERMSEPKHIERT